MRNPTGKIGEEFMGWATSPLDMLHRKLGTFARPAYEIIANDRGFGRKVYDPYAKTWGDTVKNAGRIATTILGDQVPLQAIKSAKDYFEGVGSKAVNAAQVLGPLLGLTFSKGAPGGPAVGVMYQAKDAHEYQVNEAMPGIREQIQKGDIEGAREAMHQLGMQPGYQKWVIKTTLNPSLRLSKRAMKDFAGYATDDQRAAMDEARQ